MYGILFTLPAASTTLADVGAYSEPIASDLMPIVFLGLGVFLGLFIIAWMISAVASALSHRKHE